MAARVGGRSVGGRTSTKSLWGPRRERFSPATLWLLGFASAAVLAAYEVGYVSHLPQMDFQVYRMGGHHAFGASLYSSEITVLGRHLLFTYPPVAAVLFWPVSHFSNVVGQTIWDAINLVALTSLIAVSIAGARSKMLVRSDWRTALILVAPVGFLLYPVRSDLVIGQINIVLVLMIVTDLTVGVSWRGRRLPEGVLVGLAAAVKLTPLVFIPYLVVSRQWRAARNATLTFAAVTSAMFAVTPHASWLYFSKEALDVKRIGKSDVLGNQTLHAAIVRAHFSASVFDLIGVAVLCAGIALAAVAYNRSSRLLATLVCAGSGLMLSPISWIHHYVWIVPALIWVFLGVDRPAQRAWWTAVVALPFVVVPPQSSGGIGVLWYLRDNVYVVSTLVLIGLVGLMLWSRRHAFATNHAPESDPDPIGNSIEAVSDQTATRMSARGIRGLVWSSSTDTDDRVARPLGSSATPRKKALVVGSRPPVGP